MGLSENKVLIHQLVNHRFHHQNSNVDVLLYLHHFKSHFQTHPREFILYVISVLIQLTIPEDFCAFLFDDWLNSRHVRSGAFFMSCCHGEAVEFCINENQGFNKEKWLSDCCQ
jgi:hypothetical protein